MNISELSRPYFSKTEVENSFFTISIKSKEDNFVLKNETHCDITRDFLSKKTKRENLNGEEIYSSKKTKKYQTYSPLARTEIIETVNLY